MDEFHLLFCLNWADRFRHWIGQGQFVEGINCLIADAVHQVGKQRRPVYGIRRVAFSGYTPPDQFLPSDGPWKVW